MVSNTTEIQEVGTSVHKSSSELSVLPKVIDKYLPRHVYFIFKFLYRVLLMMSEHFAVH
jgi:hypothetical protein